MEKDDDEVKASYLTIRWFITLLTSGNINTDHLDLACVFCNDHFALHCIGSHFVSRAYACTL